ncbi:MAG: J domain-containing protein [Acidimicrobiales bacterium]
MLPTASVEEIRRAYLERARRHHPDHGGSPDQMRRLNEAWAVLGDARNRQAYDTGLAPSAPELDDDVPVEPPEDWDLFDTTPLGEPPTRWVTMFPPVLFVVAIATGAVGLVLDDVGVLGFAFVLFGLSLVAVAAATLLVMKSSVRSGRR